MADVVIYPKALFDFLGIYTENSDYESINSYYEKALDIVKGIRSAEDDYSEIRICYEDGMAKAGEIFKDRENKWHYDYIISMKDEESYLNQGNINTYNTKIDGIKKELQMTIDEFSQRYNTINSNYDNMLRVITTMISELTQELKGFLRF